LEYTSCPITTFYAKQTQFYAVFSPKQLFREKTNPIQTQFMDIMLILLSCQNTVLIGVNLCLNLYVFMQNEPKFIRRRRIASAAMTRRYDKITVLWTQKNEPKRTQFISAKRSKDGLVTA